MASSEEDSSEPITIVSQLDNCLKFKSIGGGGGGGGGRDKIEWSLYKKTLPTLDIYSVVVLYR